MNGRALGLVALLAGACAPRTPTVASPATHAETLERRPFVPRLDGAPVRAGVAYGPYRAGQRPGGAQPTDAQILEDLRLIAPRWHLIRIYGSRGSTEAILRIIHDENLPLRVILGAWIAPDAAGENAAELEEAIRLAHTWEAEVVAVSVGNETQVSWSDHRMAPQRLVVDLGMVRAAVDQPVTTADDYSFWTTPQSDPIAREVDFLLVHAHPMWNGKTLDEAMPWTTDTLRAVATAHPGIPVVLGETGWATATNPEGPEAEHVRAPAGEAEQATFYRAFTAWAATTDQPWFWFEAFDEPWKGGDDPREIEKHWGLYDVDRAPKAALGGR